jgi:hypothetical protein
MDKKPDKWTTFLRGLHLTVEAQRIFEIARRLREGESVNSLVAKGSRPGLAGTGTIKKVKKLLEAGELAPLLDSFGQHPFPDPHIAGLEGFLKGQLANEFETALRELSVERLVNDEKHPEFWPVFVALRSSELPVAQWLWAHLEGHHLSDLFQSWIDTTSHLLWLRKEAAVRLFEQAETTTKLALVADAAKGGSGIRLRILLRIFDWATDQVEGSAAGPVEMDIASGSRWPHHEAALVWHGPEVAVGTKVEMELAQGALRQLAISWASDESIRQILTAIQNADYALRELLESIEHFDPTSLEKGKCIGCAEVA